MPMQPRRKRIAPIFAALLAIVVAIWLQRTTPSKPVTQTSAAPTPAATRVEAPKPSTTTRATSPLDAIAADERAEVEKTLDLIERNGPFPHRQDGTVFSNREGRLPSRPRGYYREYTVRTPGASNRGARRIVRGSEGELYYTRDHYESFIRIDG
ncbi:MAG TPA: ribonuclease domain-containing protein [Thermoanaerobaculia bacterium]